jgi:uracil-DNA glycosylase family 4
MIVPNQFPRTSNPFRIAVVGEAPGAEEDRLGVPFSGHSGDLLNTLLSRAGVYRSDVFVGNVCQVRPPDNELWKLGWNSEPVRRGLQQLRSDLTAFKPNVCLLLGNYALKAAKDPTQYKVNFKVSDWRGSVFVSSDPASPFLGLKCLSSYHPAFCLRDYANTPFLMLDIRRTATQSRFPELRERPRRVEWPTTAHEAITALRMFRAERTITAYDIEGYWNDLRCIGFCNHPEYALVIPFKHADGRPYWSRLDHGFVAREVAFLLEDPLVPKVAQAGLYDRFCLHYGCNIRVQGTEDDTMDLHWSLYSELARDIKDSSKKTQGRKGMGLAIQLSLYTDIPYYKNMRHTEDDATFYTYCGYDCIGTFRVRQEVHAILDGPGDPLTFSKDEFQSMKRLYRTIIELKDPFLYMEVHGIRYDSETAKARVKDLRRKLWECQAQLNYITGKGFSWKSKNEISARTRELMLTKKGDRPYKDYEESYARIKTLLREPTPDLATIGEIETLCEVGLNIESPQKSCQYFYDEVGFPEQYNEDKQTKKKSRTTDFEALLKLSRICEQDEAFKPYKPVIELAIEARALSTRIGMLEIHADPDGRIRCGYNVVGSNTGRVTCYESPTGSGYNLQTIPNYTDSRMAPGGVLGDRDLFVADEGYWLFQCDLKGADGWTVAAYSAMCGDSTMLDDYRGGVSPFERLTLKLLGVKIPKERDELKATIKKHVEKDGWPRFACKRVQHGGCYLEGPVTVSRNILKDSEGKLYFPPNECAALLRFLLDEMYWGVRKWHQWVERRIAARQVLIAASGQVRQFFGRPHEILTKAVAFEPQANTTYATNLAMRNLWNDPHNRREMANVSQAIQYGPGNKGQNNGGKHAQSLLRIQPLHQVHDALVGQFPKADTTWAVGKIASYFQNPLQIAHQAITIPFDGGFGPSWGSLKEGVIAPGRQLTLTPHEPNLTASGIDRRL